MNALHKQVGRVLFAIALLSGGAMLVWTQVHASDDSHLLLWIGVVAIAFSGFLLFPNDVKAFVGMFSLPFLRRWTEERPAAPPVPPPAPPPPTGGPDGE